MRFGVRRRVALGVAAMALAFVADAAVSPAQADPAKTKKKPPPPPPLNGQTYEYTYDGGDPKHPERGWDGRAFVHTAAMAENGPLPILVFLHGLNAEQIKYRWFGGGQEGDVRRIVAEMMEAEQVPPMIVAAPTSTDLRAVGAAMTSWPAFDLDVFLDKTAERLDGVATIDRQRVFVAGHSGAGCNIRGGLATALKAKTPVVAELVIDTCMGIDLAKELAHARPALNVIVSWQTMTWETRFFDDFKRAFVAEVKKAPPAGTGVLRELDYTVPKNGSPHDAMVGITLRKWLPKLLPVAAPAGPATPPTSAPGPNL